MEEMNTHQMIAITGFSPGAGVVRRWTRFVERPGLVKARIESRQAMEDVTQIDGLELQHAQRLARAGVLTFDDLAELGPERLAGIGFDPEAIEAVSKWQRLTEEDHQKAMKAKPALVDIAGIGPKTAETLLDAGIDDFEKMKAVPSEALDALGLARAAREAISAWRSAEAGKTEGGTTE